MAIKLIEFSASWCFPCKLQKPIMETIGKKYKSIKIQMIDIDNDKELASKYGIKAVPTVIIERDGKELNRFVGVTTEKEIEKALEKYK